MNYAMMLAYTIVMVIAPVVPFLVYSLAKKAREVYKALLVLQSEKRAGESIYDTAKALVNDAHEWRGMVDVSDDPGLVLSDANSPPASGVVRIGDGRERATLADLVAPQPPPKNSSGPALWPMIISELGDSNTDRLVAIDMQARHEFGVAKYGVPLVASNGRDHLADAYQEALDCVVYLRAAIESHLARTLEDTNTKELARTHQLYVDQLDLAKEIRELIRERDGR